MSDWQPAARYPDPAFVALDPSFERYRVSLAKVERLATGMRWSEGPVWLGDTRALIWSDVPLPPVFVGAGLINAAVYLIEFAANLL